jgi:uncharacterized membrane protein
MKSPTHSSSPRPSRSSSPANVWTDQRVEMIIGNLLLTGVLLSGAIVLFGGILYLLQYGHVSAHYSGFSASRAELHAVGPVIREALHLDSRAIIQLGLLLLIATPVSRVAFSIVAFALERDSLYVWITLVVFAILMFSLFGPAL